jgi:hypothetical protein
VDAVRAIIDSGEDHATPKEVEGKLGIGRGATYDRIARALLLGYIVNIAGERERGKKLRPGHPLPDQPEFLPSRADVNALVGSLSDSASDSANGSTKQDSEELSDCPTSPTDAREAA